MRVRTWFLPLTLAGLATASLAVAAPQMGRPAASAVSRQTTLSPQDQAAAQQLRDLGKEAQIARLELRLAELKGAPERDLAAKKQAATEARGRLRQWQTDHPQLAQQLRQSMRGGRGLRHRGGLGMRGGRGLGMQGGGMGMRQRRGMGGDGQGMRGGRGLMGGRGGGERMRMRQRDRLNAPDQGATVQSAPATQPAEPAPQPDETTQQPQQETQPEE